ncbi:MULTISPECIES: FG-GAP-like repeat-containing protein [Streptomyces]|uniref:FG-GAP-like repeat-containing protein n=2 Tax=Streptomyces TaxID=1883 RepID=A0ABU4JZK0_9ACTN|nr:FG-GAP-like repeat-containing protein [Streptomyces roseolus]MDX2290925.1 FG-GAP-like repeat-containing protein [Streptomyces roseolus]
MKHLSPAVALVLAVSAGTLSTPAVAADAADWAQSTATAETGAETIAPLAIPVDSVLLSAGQTGMLSRTGTGASAVHRWTRLADGVTTILPAGTYWGSAGTDLVVSREGSVFTFTDMSGAVEPAVLDTSGFNTAAAPYTVDRVVGRSLLMTTTVNGAEEFRLVSLGEDGNVADRKVGLPDGSRARFSYSSGPDSLAVSYGEPMANGYYRMRLSTVDVTTGAITASHYFLPEPNHTAIAVTPSHLTWVLDPYGSNPQLQVLARATGSPVSTTPLIRQQTLGLTVHHVGDWVALVRPGGGTATSPHPYTPLTARPLDGGAEVPLLDHAGSVTPSPDGSLLVLGGTLAHGEGLYRIAPDPVTGKPAATLLRTFGRPTALTVLKESLPPAGTFDFDRAGGKLSAGWTLSRFNARTTLTLTHTASGRTVKLVQEPREGVSAHSLTWDGVYKDGLPAYNGAYAWTMTAAPANGVGPAVERKGSFTLTRAPRPHDFDDNGSPDVLARDVNGNLSSYDIRQVWSLDAYEDPYELPIGGGWNAYDRILAAGNLGGTRHGDLIARDKSGILWLYQGKSGHRAPFAPRTRIGGWGIYNQFAAGSDVTGDGRNDLLAADKAGMLWLYPGTGNTTAPFTTRRKIGGGWGIYNQLTATGNLAGGPAGDLVARDKAGVLWLYLGKGDGTFTTRTRIGGGWGSFKHLIGIGDVNNDGRNDLLAAGQSNNGDTVLHLYRGTGQWTTPLAPAQTDTVEQRSWLGHLS